MPVCKLSTQELENCYNCTIIACFTSQQYTSDHGFALTLQ